MGWSCVRLTGGLCLLMCPFGGTGCEGVTLWWAGRCRAAQLARIRQMSGQVCPPGSSVHGVLQASTLEWVTMPSSRASSWPRDWTQVIWSEVKPLRCVQLFAIPWTVAYTAPLSMEFSRQEYWSGLPFPSPGDLPDPGIEARSPALQADTLPSEPPGKPQMICHPLKILSYHQKIVSKWMSFLSFFMTIIHIW